MLKLDLTGGALADYIRTLTTHHEVDIRVSLLDLTHAGVADLSPRLVDGQVDLDAGGERSKASATLTLFDPDLETGLTSSDITELPSAFKRLVRVFYGVRPAPSTSGLSGTDAAWSWTYAPLITGVIISTKRTAPNVTIEIQGKEVIVRQAVHGTRTWPKGTLITSIVRDVLKMTGEIDPRIEIDIFPQRLVRPQTLLATTDAWEWLRSLIASGLPDAATPFYNGHGTFVLRRRDTATRFIFSDGANAGTSSGASLLSAPVVSDDTVGHLTTRVVVRGKGSVMGSASVPATHPLAASTTMRGTASIAWTKEVTDENITTTAAANARAAAELDAALAQDIYSLSFSALPVPILELGDVVRVQTDKLGAKLLLTKVSFPLTVSGAMSVGTNSLMSRSNPYRAQKGGRR